MALGGRDIFLFDEIRPTGHGKWETGNGKYDD